MTELSTDARLVADFVAGDTSALAAIYDRYAAGLYDTAAAMLSDRHDAADMVQDVFCIAAERLSQLREPDRLKPWLYSVLRHEVYRRTKKRKRATPVDFQDERTPDVASGYDPHAAGEAVAHEELATLVRSAASGLDERDRLVLELSVRQGLSGADLADALGVTPDQSYSLVHRMRDRVEKSLGALTVAKAGRRDCSQLAQILTGWDGELTILLRKRVNRHIEECATCDSTRKKYAPLALFGAAPVFAMPFGLRDKVLAAAIPGGGSAGSSGGKRDIRFDAHHGFPRAVRAGRHVAMWATTATVAAVIGGGVLVASIDGETASPDPTPASAAPPFIDSSESGGSDTTPEATQDLTGSTAPTLVEDTTPATTVPVSTTPATTIPVSTTPASTIPASTIPASTTPATTIPASTAPATTTPANTAPTVTLNSQMQNPLPQCIPSNGTQVFFRVNDTATSEVVVTLTVGNVAQTTSVDIPAGATSAVVTFTIPGIAVGQSFTVVAVDQNGAGLTSSPLTGSFTFIKCP